MEAFTKVNGVKEFSMAMERCTFPMGRRKLVSLKITCLKEDLSNLTLNKSLLESDQVHNRVKRIELYQIKQLKQTLTTLQKKTNLLKLENQLITLLHKREESEIP